jgi:hypothetical protein
MKKKRKTFLNLSTSNHSQRPLPTRKRKLLVGLELVKIVPGWTRWSKQKVGEQRQSLDSELESQPATGYNLLSATNVWKMTIDEANIQNHNTYGCRCQQPVI